MSRIYKTWVEISKDAVRHNVGVFRKIIGPKTKLMAVVKSNAYGHGLWDFSKLAAEFGADWFGVDSLSEALKLREKGIEKPILVLGYTRRGRLIEAVQNRVSVTLYDNESLRFWAKNINRFAGTPLRVHLKIDTGMRRQGIYPEDLPAFLK
ncbi:MAG: alanine racemase, partial [bacterium]|nr:alanine racemase [bacterium]